MGRQSVFGVLVFSVHLFCFTLRPVYGAGVDPSQDPSLLIGSGDSIYGQWSKEPGSSDYPEFPSPFRFGLSDGAAYGPVPGGIEAPEEASVRASYFIGVRKSLLDQGVLTGVLVGSSGRVTFHLAGGFSTEKFDEKQMLFGLEYSANIPFSLRLSAGLFQRQIHYRSDVRVTSGAGSFHDDGVGTLDIQSLRFALSKDWACGDSFFGFELFSYSHPLRYTYSFVPKSYWNANQVEMQRYLVEQKGYESRFSGPSFYVAFLL